MSFEKFVPTIEAEKIIQERNKLLIYVANCTQEWEGHVEKAGDTITVFVEGDVPVYILESDGNYTAHTDLNGNKMNGVTATKGKDIVQEDIPDPSQMHFGEIVLQVKKLAVFNVAVGDIDQRLSAKKDLMGIHRRAIAKQLATQEDKVVFNTMKGFTKSLASALKLKDGTAIWGATALGDDNIFDMLDRVVQYFREKNVKDSEKVHVECSAKFERYVKKAMRALDTDNTELIRGRKCPTYSNLVFETTNECWDGTQDYVTFRTEKAVAFFDPAFHIEAYRPDKGFKDCLKGYQIFDCGIVLPQELVVLAPTYA